MIFNILFLVSNPNHNFNFDYISNLIKIDIIYYKDFKNNKKYDMYIVEIQNSESYIKSIDKIQKKYPGIYFYGASSTCTKNDIILASKINCQNIIKLPFENDYLIHELKNTKVEFNQYKLSNSQLAQNFDLSILIVDDSEYNISLLKETLSVFDANVYCYTDPVKASEIINQEKFDLILLDVMMPKMTGFELAKIIRKSKINNNASLIFISADHEAKSKVQGYSYNSYAYIEKPINVTTLRSQITSILELKKMHNLLFSEQEKFHNLLKYSQDEIMLLDSDLKIINYNSKILSNNLKDTSFYNINWTNFSEVKDKIQNFKNKSERRSIILNTTLKNINNNDSKIYSVNITLSKIYTHDDYTKIQGFVVIIRDVTEEILIQTQKDTFIATLTHDLKTPIRAQINALNLMLKGTYGKLTKDQEVISKELLISCKFMKAMTDNLLTKYKNDRGQLEIVKRKSCLKLILESVYENLKYILNQKNQQVIINYNSKIEKVDVDEVEIERVLNNLIVNASEYSGNNTIIFIDVINDDRFLKVSIIDSGQGIPFEEQKNIFDEYVTSSKQYRKIGSGLGLYISKKIIEKHGGNIYLESQEDVGSKFTFTLPYTNLDSEYIENNNKNKLYTINKLALLQ